MEPIKFEQVNTILGADQPEYEPLPAYVNQTTREVETVICMNVSLEEAEQIMKTRKLWITQLTFTNPFQPIRLDTRFPFNNENPAISVDVEVFSAVQRIPAENQEAAMKWLNIVVGVMKQIIKKYPYNQPVSIEIDKQLQAKALDRFLLKSRGDFLPKLWYEIDFDNYIGVLRMQSIITQDDHSTNGKIIQI